VKLAARLCLFVFSALAQQPAFEAASIKVSNTPSNGMNGYVGIRPGGSLAMGNVTLEDLIHMAYGAAAYRIMGGPAWMKSERYNVDAKPAAPVSQEVARQMFQNLLTERFHLQAHGEKRSVDGYVLTAPKGDARMQKLADDAPIGFRHQQAGHIEGPGNIDMLARVLKGSLGVPVEDQTGLTGRYQIALEWSTGAADDGLPSIQSVLGERLGLTLKREKVQIDVLVVDNAQRPTAN